MRLINALVIAVPATALMTVPSLAQTYGDRPHIGGWGWGGMIYGSITVIVFIAVVVVVVVLLVRWLGRPGHGGALHSPPGKMPWTSSRNGSPKARSTRKSSKSDGACWMNRD